MQGEGNTMVNEVFNELYERTVRSYLDVLLMQELKNNSPKSTHELMDAINSKYSSNISWGLLFATLISMQKNGLLNEVSVNQKAVYELSLKGSQRAVLIVDFAVQLKDFLNSTCKAAVA
jgi:hypothetical protein